MVEAAPEPPETSDRTAVRTAAARKLARAKGSDEDAAAGVVAAEEARS
jgi:hypothetical protein